jgi:hypothetical protein
MSLFPIGNTAPFKVNYPIIKILNITHFTYQRHDWNMFESGVKHHNHNPTFYIRLTTYFQHISYQRNFRFWFGWLKNWFNPAAYLCLSQARPADGFSTLHVVTSPLFGVQWFNVRSDRSFGRRWWNLTSFHITNLNSIQMSLFLPPPSTPKINKIITITNKKLTITTLTKIQFT